MTIRNKQLIIITVFAFMALGAGIILLVKNIKNSSTPPRLLPAPSNSPYLYQSINQPFKVYLGDRNNQGQPKVKFQFNGSFAEFTPTKSANGETKFAKTDDKTVVYRNVYPNTNLVYTLTDKGVKEEIVLQRPPALDSASFRELTFNLNLKNVIPRKSLDGQEISYFIDPVTEEYRFHLPKPFMVDAAGNRSEEVELKILRSSALSSASFRDFYTISLIPNPQWLSSAVYPVTIDPSIVHDTSSEFATGTSNRVQDIGSGASPQLELPYHELTTDIHTAGLWHMNESSWTNDCSTNTVIDSSGNANHGKSCPASTGPTGGATGKFGNAGSFDGSNDYVNVGTSLNPITGAFTVELWFKTTSTVGARIVADDDNNGSTSWAFSFGDPGVGRLRFYVRGAATVLLDSNKTVNDGSWHHLAAVRDPALGLRRIYIDGTLDVELTNDTTTFSSGDSGPLTIGGESSASAEYPVQVQATIDEVRVSNIARSPEEIRQDAQRFPYGVHTSDTIDLTGGTSVVTSLDSLQWSESGVQTGDGETVYSSTNLVSQWNLNETSGTTAANNGGAGSCGGVPANCNGTLTGFANTTGQDVAAGSGWTAVNRKWGAGALMFDGSNDYVNVPYSDALNPTSAITIAAWFKTSATGRHDLITRFSTTGSFPGYGIVMNPSYDCGTSSGQLGFWVGDNTNRYLCTTTTYHDGNWHYVVGTYDGTTATIYVDGVAQASGTRTNGLNQTSQDLKIGINPSGTTTPWNGIIDSAILYSRALGASEILSNHQAGNIEFQTRTGSTSSPPSGWEEWRPVTAETAILSMDADSANWSTSNSNLLTKANESTIKVEGTGSLKSTVGAPQVDASTVGLWHMEETSGTGAYIKDSTANANHGTPTGTSVVNGFYGKAKSFATPGPEYVDIPNFGTFTTVSVETWIYRTGATSARESIVSYKEGDSPNCGFVLALNEDGSNQYPRIFVNVNAAWQFAEQTTSVPLNTWIHLAATYDGSTIRLYRDGAQVASTAASGTMTQCTQGTRIGNRAPGTGNSQFPGTIDEVRISSAARTAEEIAEAYRAGRDHRLSRTITAADLSAKTKIPFFVAVDRPGTLVETYVGETDHSVYASDANTAGLWHLEEHAGSGAYIKDSSSNGYHGTPTGTTFVQGKLGRARDFSGSGDYVGIGNSVYTSGAFTVEAWVKPNSACLSPTQGCGFIGNSNYSGSGGNGYHMGWYSDGNFSFYIENSSIPATYGVSVTTSSYFTAEQWKHVVGVYNGSQMFLYINGVLVGGPVSATAPASATYNLQIGRDQQGGWSSPEFGGSLDEVRVSNAGRTADEIRMAYEYGRRTHQINVDFVTTAGTDGPTSTSDTQFTPDTTTGLYKGDTVIVREKVDATTYMMQGEVTSISSGLVTVASWTGTAPSGGYSTNADVFKWQREYWDVTDILAADRNATVRLGLRVLDATEGFDMYLDDFRSNTNYLTGPSGSTITSTANRYIQYRAVLSTSDTAVTPQLTSVTINYTVNNPPNTPTLDSPANGATNITLTPQLKTTTTDTETDYLRYKIELCTNAAMTQNCQTFDQTASQTGWSGQNAQAGTAYTSGTQATYTIQTALSAGTTYYWRSYAIDPGGANSWSATQGTPNSFTTTQTPNAPSSLWTEGQTNPTQVTDTTPEFSAIYNDPDTGDIANYFQIQVNTQSDFLGTTMWNSGQTSMTNCTAGTRCADISYAGSTLSWGATYYWRIRYWDQAGVVSPYSTESAYFTMSAFPPPTGCMIDDSGQPSQLIVKWTDNTTNESQFRIERNVNGAGFVFLINKAADSTSHTDSTSANNTYQYRVRAESANGNSDWCTTATVNLSTGTFNLQGVNVSGVTIK